MIDEFLGTAIKAVESSGKILIQYFDKLHDSRQKNENIRDLVTEVDFLAEKNIKRILANRFPKHNIIAEESGGLDIKSEYCWHVDPIDGTVNYSHGIPLCAVSIGLEFNGEIIIGAVHNPFTKELFYASQGNGAFLNGHTIRVSEKKKLKECLYVAAFSSESDDNKGKEYQTFGEMNDNSRGVLRIGSAALALAYLACGRIDGFWVKGLHEWDIAGGLALVREAGGQLSDMNGNTFVIGASTLVASNKYIHKPLLGKIDNFFVKT